MPRLVDVLGMNEARQDSDQQDFNKQRGGLQDSDRGTASDSGKNIDQDRPSARPSPVRPSLPFLLLPAVAMWISMILAESICLDFFAEEGLWYELIKQISSSFWAAIALLCLGLAAAAVLLPVIVAALWALISARRGRGVRSAFGKVPATQAMQDASGRAAATQATQDASGRAAATQATQPPQNAPDKAHAVQPTQNVLTQNPSVKKHLMQVLPVAVSTACGIALGLIVGAAAWGSVLITAQSIGSAQGPWKVEVTSDASLGNYSWYSMGVATSSDGVKTGVQIYWDTDGDPLPYGAVFESSARPSAIDASNEWLFQSMVAATLNPGIVEEWNWAANPYGFLGAIRQSCLDLILANEGEGAALLAGVVLGYPSGLEGTAAEADFRTTGLTHLVAVSGGHMAVVAMLVSWALGIARVPRWASTILLALFVIAYLILTAMQPSAIRSCIMAVLAGLSWIAGRRSGTIHVLVPTVVIMLVIDPSSAFSVGFALSVAGVGSLGLFMGLADAWICRLLPDKLGKFSQPVSMTLVAQGATTPISASMFSMLSIGSPFCNLLASPVVSFLLGAGIVSLLVWAVLPPVGQTMIWLLCLLSEFAVWLVACLAKIPFVAIPVHMDQVTATLIAVTVCVLLWVIWPLPKRKRIRQITLGTCVAVLVFAIAFSPKSNPEVVVMDVGQGDSILIRDKSSTVLVDTGQYGSELLDALGRQQITSLDSLLITHFDADHCGALADIRSIVQIDTVVVASGSVALASKDTGAQEVLEDAKAIVGEDGIIELSLGDTIYLSENMTLTMLWPQDSLTSSENSDSVCLLLTYTHEDGKGSITTMLLTGDAEAPELSQIIDSGLDHADIIKVGHHGSDDAVDAEVLEALKPSAAIISVGADNRYGHPTTSTLEVLEEAGVEVFRTDQNGDVTIEFGTEGAQISCATI